MCKTNRVWLSVGLGAAIGKWMLNTSPAEPDMFPTGKSQNFSEIFEGGINKYG